MQKTRFSPDDLCKIEAEFAALKERLCRLGELLLRANLAHTQANAYDARVRTVADGLYNRLARAGKPAVE